MILHCLYLILTTQINVIVVVKMCRCQILTTAMLTTKYNSEFKIVTYQDVMYNALSMGHWKFDTLDVR